MRKVKPGAALVAVEEDAATQAAVAAWARVERIRKEREARKVRVTIRLDADVVARLRADGPGWQSEANGVLWRAVFGEIPMIPEEEEAINLGIAADPDTWELTDEDIARMRPMAEVAPGLVARSLAERARKDREARTACGKTRVTIRLDADVVARLREGGPGWQTRANAALRQAVFGS